MAGKGYWVDSSLDTVLLVAKVCCGSGGNSGRSRFGTAGIPKKVPALGEKFISISVVGPNGEAPRAGLEGAVSEGAGGDIEGGEAV